MSNPSYMPSEDDRSAATEREVTDTTGALHAGTQTTLAPFQHLASLAARVMQVPSALIYVHHGAGSFVCADGDMLGANAAAFCRGVLGGAPLVVHDVATYPVLDSQRVLVAHGVRAYAAARLLGQGDRVRAVLCVLDVAAHPWQQAELQRLQDLATTLYDTLTLWQEAQAYREVEGERANLLAQVQSALSARDQFMAMASHELKTPLTAMIGYVELLKRRMSKGESDEKATRALETIYRQAGRLNQIISTLIDLSALQSGKLDLRTESFNLATMVDAVASTVRHTLEQHTLDVRVLDDKLTVRGDKRRLGIALHKLIDNAVKYSPEGGLVLVEVARRGWQASVTVSDQGIGIPEESLPLLFERFYRAKNVDWEHISGLGINLYFIKHLLALHGGSIEVLSAQHQGSVFTMLLPLYGGPHVYSIAP